MKVFQTYLEESFRRRLRDRLQAVLPDPARFAAPGFEQQIRTAIDQAVDCGITKEAQIANFVEAVFIHLSGFPENGLPKETLPALYAYGVDPAVKIDRFIDWCKERTAEVAA